MESNVNEVMPNDKLTDKANETKIANHKKAIELLTEAGYKDIIIQYAITVGSFLHVKFSRAHKGKGRETETRRFLIEDKDKNLINESSIN